MRALLNKVLTRGRLLAIPISGVVVLLVLTGAPGSALAEDADAGVVTWAVRPADATGPDGRTWAELELDPGESADEYLAVSNLGDDAVTFRLAAADGYFTDKGHFNMLPADRASEDAGTWITVEDSVRVDAGETAVVPYTVTVPENSEPGDHAAGVAASITAANQNDGNSVDVDSRVGFRVMTRVAGELRPSLETSETHVDYSIKWNPFASGTVDVSFDLVNTGNVRLDVAGFARTGGNEASYPAADHPALELLPGDRTSVALRLDGVWPTGRVPVDIVAEPVVVAADNTPAPALESQGTRITVWAVPWPQLIVLVGILLVITAAVLGRVRSRRHVAQLITAAREEGARSAMKANDGD